jgi:hypothetical protein
MPSQKSFATASKSIAKAKTLSPPYGNFKKRIERLNAWWGAKMLGEVNGEACCSYGKQRRNRGGAKRDLEDLRAAVGHHTAEGYHREIVKVPLPEKGEPRDKWLTRSDATKLIWVCWRYREMQKRSRWPTDDVKAPPTQALAAKLSHVALYALLIAMPLVGWGMLSAGGYPIVLYGSLHLPAILPHDDRLHAILLTTHIVLAYMFFVIILLHVAAALFHALIRRDGVFRAMAGTGALEPVARWARATHARFPPDKPCGAAGGH